MILGALSCVPAPVVAQFGPDTIGAKLLRPIVNRAVASGESEVEVQCGVGKGLRLGVHLRHEKYYFTGLHEPWVQQAIADRLRPGMIFWDVGAHIGFHTLSASRIVTASGMVRAFEPSSENRQRLLANIHRNNASNVVVESCAVGADAGSVMLYEHSSSTMRSLIPEREQSLGEVVTCRTLDELSLSNLPPDLIKIDVEGAELDVLNGAQHLLRSVHPILIIEFLSAERLGEARKLLTSYTLQHIGGKDWLAT